MPAFQQDFILFRKALDAEASRAVAQAARDGERDIKADQATRRGIAPGVVSAVDGVQGRAYEAVKPNGVIVELFDYRAEIVYACFQELVARSPIGPEEGGHYRNEHFAMLDGAGLQPMTVATAQQLANVARITITNTMPYARKLEVGVTKDGSPFVHSGEPHIYESAMQPVRREFGGVAKISFGYADLANAYVGKHGQMRYPAIFIDRGDT
jgi:hypothetical protein